MLTFPELTTDRLALRSLTAADAPAVAMYRADPRVEQHQHWLPEHIDPTCLAERFTAQDFDRQGLFVGIYLRYINVLIGDCTLVPMFDTQTCALGYSLDPAYQRQGYATEAARRICEWVLSQPRFRRIIAAVDSTNPRSSAVLNRVGMRCIDRRDTKNIRGEPTTVLWYQLTT